MTCYDRCMVKERVQKDVEKSVAALGKDPGLVVVERPRDPSHGDYATNIALRLGEGAFAAKLVARLTEDFDIYSVSEAAGFVNITLAPEVWHEELRSILEKKENYAARDIGKGKRVNVEFISANPTGPLTAGNARGGFVGDVIAAVLAQTGHSVTREYYFNDAGTQVRKLVDSVAAHAEGRVTEETQYKGGYVQELADEFSGKLTDYSEKELGTVLTKAIFEKYIKGAIARMGITFDVWTNEKDLIASGAVEGAFARLEELGLLYEKEGALWVKTEELGDSRDRVVRKSNGDITYLGADIAYHIDLLEKREFECAVKVWGADHAAQVPSLEGLMKSLVPERNMVFIVMQFVRLMKGGEEFKISKRAGTYVTVEELLDEIGVDAARFFMLMRATNTHIDIDLDLAKEQSQKNPVYYVQYSYARSHQILEKAREAGSTIQKGTDISALTAPEELALIKKCAEYPELLESIVTSYDKSSGYSVHKLTTYAQELAAVFHQFYEKCYVVEDGEVNHSRLCLVSGYQTVLKDVLGLLGVSAPQKM